MGEDWDKLSKSITKEFKEYGVKATIIHQTHGAYDVTTGKKTKVSTEYDTYVLFSNVTIQESSLIGSNEIILRISPPENFDIKQNKNLMLETGGNMFTVKTIKPVMPGGTVLYYKVIAEVYDGD